MNKKSENLLRKIYSVDTEAGHRFRYHIMRAEACPDYAEEIQHCPGEGSSLASAFAWDYTNEGHLYWNRVWNRLRYA